MTAYRKDDHVARTKKKHWQLGSAVFPEPLCWLGTCRRCGISVRSYFLRPCPPIPSASDRVIGGAGTRTRLAWESWVPTPRDRWAGGLENTTQVRALRSEHRGPSMLYANSAGDSWLTCLGWAVKRIRAAKA